MSNRLDDQSPRTDWPAVPPIGPDDLELYLRRGRQLRAKAFAEGLKLTARALARAFGAVGDAVGEALDRRLLRRAQQQNPPGSIT